MKKLYLLALGCTFFAGVNASVITPEEALARMNRYQPLTRSVFMSPQLQFTLKSELGLPTVYAFNGSDGQGFVILSADDSAMPVLGYSDSGSLDKENMPPALKSWLEEYNKQIEYLQSVDAPAFRSFATRSVEWEPISPLMTTRWNQDQPYNDLCYLTFSDGRKVVCPTGCVATAMAQVMKYHEYPEKGRGSITYPLYSNVQDLSMDFSQVTFNWDSMLDSYSGSVDPASAEAVAILMKACGYSVKMEYGQYESGAKNADVPNALITYFDYDPSVRLVKRAYYTYDDWSALIYNNLVEYGPVIYAGQSDFGGHAFVCDGYSSGGYFHVNWGWGGISDGYFLLDAMTPSAQGIGGYEGGYNLKQEAIINIQKNQGNYVPSPVEIVQMGSIAATVSGNTLNIGTDGSSSWGYIGDGTAKFSLGVIVENIGQTGNPIYYSCRSNLELPHNAYYQNNFILPVNLDELGMTAGSTYKITVASHDETLPSSGWQPVMVETGCFNFLNVTKTASGYQIDVKNVDEFSVSGIETYPSPVYYNKPVRFKATFNNKNNIQISRNISAYFITDDPVPQTAYFTDGFMVTVDPNSGTTMEWVSTTWNSYNNYGDLTSDKNFKVRFYDNETNQFLEGEANVAVKVNAPQPVYNASFSIENGEFSIVDGRPAYVVEGNTLNLNLNLDLTEGYFSKIFTVTLLIQTSPTQYTGVLSYTVPVVPMLTAPANENYSAVIELPDVEYGSFYMVRVRADQDYLPANSLIIFKEKDNAGVEVPEESTEPDEYKVYNLMGRLVLTTKEYSDIRNLASGIYVINGKKVMIR